MSETLKTTKKKIIKNILVQGYFEDSPDLTEDIHEAISLLSKEGKIVSIASLKIEFINEDYFYTFRGNPFKLYVKEVNHTTYTDYSLEKGRNSSAFLDFFRTKFFV